MIDTIRLDGRASDLKVGKTGRGYSRVIVNVTDKLFYTAGDDSGETLEISCPFGTQAVADDILDAISGYVYQPYDVNTALIDPTAEIGDAVAIKDTYGGLYAQKTDFGRMIVSSASAPQSEETDNEYPYKTKTERTIAREIANVRADLSVQADEISAKVSETGGDGAAFSWSLTKDGFVLNSNGTTIFKADGTGISVNGEITATSGKIGAGENPFIITENGFYKGVTSLNDTSVTNGVYVGSDGIRIGKKFKVDSAGNLTAASGTFDGTISAKNINYGGNYGELSGAALSSRSVGGGKISKNGVGSSEVTTDINTSLGYADTAHNVFANGAQVANMKATNLSAVNAFSFRGTSVAWKQVVTPTGTISALCWNGSGD